MPFLFSLLYLLTISFKTSPSVPVKEFQNYIVTALLSDVSLLLIGDLVLHPAKDKINIPERAPAINFLIFIIYLPKILNLSPGADKDQINVENWISLHLNRNDIK